MSHRPAIHAVVSLPALDVRSRPDHRAELKSQFLMGEVLRRTAGAGDSPWWRVRSLTDGYSGWIRTWGVVAASAARAAGWRRRARAVVSVPYAEVRAGRGAGIRVSPLFWCNRVIAGRARGRHVPVELPDGRRGWAPRSAFARPRRGRLVDRVMGLLGVPYLWGGRTPLGMDCSSFTQLVLMEQGVALPRDAADQFRAVPRLRAGQLPDEGDLVFFGANRGLIGHVGLVLRGGYFAHSRGRIRINSIDPDNPLWDKELTTQLRGFGRPVRTPRKAARSA